MAAVVTTAQTLAAEARSLWAEARQASADARALSDAIHAGLIDPAEQAVARTDLDHLNQHARVCRSRGDEAFRQAERLDREAEEDRRRMVAEQIGPRTEGVIYTDGDSTYRVAWVVTDVSEARRIMKRRAAQFAIELVDIFTGNSRYTCAVWTGSDRVLKAVA